MHSRSIPLTDTTVLLDTEGRVAHVDIKQLLPRARYFCQVVPSPRPGDSLQQWLAGLVDVGKLPPKALIRSYDLGAQDSEIAFFDVE